ncbi:MAG: hypothetical protein WA627_16780, partial [Candidatus Sulfotelmatobacter sp.]
MLPAVRPCFAYRIKELRVSRQLPVSATTMSTAAAVESTTATVEPTAATMESAAATVEPATAVGYSAATEPATTAEPTSRA